MKLKDARLCINCDEVYESEIRDSRSKIQDSGALGRCPSCGSGAYGLLTRWIPPMREGDDRYWAWVSELKQELRKKGGNYGEHSRV